MSAIVKVVESIFGGGEEKPREEPKPAEPEATKPGAAAADLGPQNKEVAARANEFAVREQTVGQRAAAAGVTRSDNDADLLGYVVPKKRSAARSLLG